MTNATPPTAPNLATSRQKSEASPRIRSASALNMTLHGRPNCGPLGQGPILAPKALDRPRTAPAPGPAAEIILVLPGRKSGIRRVFGRLAYVTFPVIGVVGG